jgi:hypothetical protein
LACAAGLHSSDDFLDLPLALCFSRPVAGQLRFFFLFSARWHLFSLIIEVFLFQLLIIVDVFLSQPGERQFLVSLRSIFSRRSVSLHSIV